MHQRRLLTGLGLVPVILVAAFHRYGPELTFLIVGGVMTLAARELWRILVGPSWKTLFWGCLLIGWGLLISAYLRSAVLGICIAGGGSWLVAVLIIATGWRNGRLRLGCAYILIFYLCVPMASLVALRQAPNGAELILFAILVSCLTDTGGLYVGTFWGRRLLSPSLSPKKTVEGAIGGLVAAVLSVIGWCLVQNFWLEPGMIFWMPSAPGAWLQIILLSFIVALLAQVGDLAESMLKRDAGIKDSGSISTATGHGGVLDMLDSLLWTGPAMFLFALLTGEL